MDCGNNVDAFLWVPIDCYSMFDTMYVHGARITSNSYGPSVSSYPELAGAYDEGCQMTDAYMWDHKDFNVHLQQVTMVQLHEPYLEQHVLKMFMQQVPVLKIHQHQFHHSLQEDQQLMEGMVLHF